MDRIKKLYVDAHGAIDALLKDADHEAFDLAAACVLANGREGDATAVVLVAPPSTSKTEMVNAFSGVKWTYEQTSMTAQTFVSGWKSGSSTDPSLLARLEKKGKTCLLNKEFTTVMEMRQSERDTVLAHIREVMDGSLSKDFGTGKTVSWSGKLGLLAAITPAIEIRWGAHTSLGARWVWVRIETPSDAESRVEIAIAAIESDDSAKVLRRELKDATTKWLESSRSVPSPGMSEKSKLYLAKLADRTAKGRTEIPKDKDGHPSGVKPEPEGTGRLARSFHRLAESLAILRGHAEINAEDLRAVTRAALDTAPVPRAKVYKAIAQRPLTIEEIVQKTSMSKSAVNRTLKDLEQVDLAVSEPVSTGQRGRPSEKWRVV
ncbi:MarR family transcriptional regulator [Candidatus Lucifugimonas marina]|uniref:ArsR family transcriptional regulator n=1 Tax=Candidatus Lucifugimonas marina TaxID=3038979 RepID=A0AAJ6CU21_9CHLR|nr:ArsR family transcriptional regulator [SAR202 cluster bacterium JH702]MDG0870173.1 ArsR family transcriptional regulator [SAR202 cluster bacterium JH639]WFG36274.1 ArsR family transcriptional regulator [SAR202 cluster bacterium JH545]WFG40207.1 ArsR family transcriptional regulator [SAR202 cluster bacterium JH1073]